MKDFAKKIAMFPVNITILAAFSVPVFTVLFFMFLVNLIFSPRLTVREVKEDLNTICNKIRNIFVRD